MCQVKPMRDLEMGPAKVRLVTVACDPCHQAPRVTHPTPTTTFGGWRSPRRLTVPPTMPPSPEIVRCDALTSYPACLLPTTPTVPQPHHVPPPGPGHRPPPPPNSSRPLEKKLHLRIQTQPANLGIFAARPGRPLTSSVPRLSSDPYPHGGPLCYLL
jgi:hypothetical protein